MWEKGCIQKQWMYAFYFPYLVKTRQASATGSNQEPRHWYQILQVTLMPAKDKTHLKCAKMSFFKILSYKSPCSLPTSPSFFCFHFNLSKFLLVSLKPSYNYLFLVFKVKKKKKSSLQFTGNFIKSGVILQLPTCPSSVVLLTCF